MKRKCLFLLLAMAVVLICVIHFVGKDKENAIESIRAQEESEINLVKEVGSARDNEKSLIWGIQFKKK